MLSVVAFKRDKVPRWSQLSRVKKANNPIGIAEGFVKNYRKRVIKCGFTQIDDSKFISDELAVVVLQKCTPLTTTLSRDTMDPQSKSGHGHGGFIRGEMIMKSSPGGFTAMSYSVRAPQYSQAQSTLCTGCGW
jgi:hypothetical protein